MEEAASSAPIVSSRVTSRSVRSELIPRLPKRWGSSPAKKVSPTCQPGIRADKGRWVGGLTARERAPLKSRGRSANCCERHPIPRTSGTRRPRRRFLLRLRALARERLDYLHSQTPYP